MSALITEQENILIGLVDRVNVNTDDENTNKSINSSNIIPDTLKIGIAVIPNDPYILLTFFTNRYQKWS